MSNELIFLLCFIAWLVIVLIVARAFGINNRTPLPPTSKRSDASEQPVDQLRKGGAL